METAQFQAELERAGLQVSSVVADGAIHRCPTSDKPFDKAGWYLYDGKAGCFGDWRSGLKKTFGSESSDMRLARMTAETAQQEKAATEAKRIIESLPDASNDNPYLKRKGVKAVPGLKSDGNVLIVPVTGPDSKVMSLQRIFPDAVNGSNKFFLKGGRASGGFFFVAGNDNLPLYVAEGLATALSVHEATGAAAVCAFNSGNLCQFPKLLDKNIRIVKLLFVAMMMFTCKKILVETKPLRQQDQ